MAQRFLVLEPVETGRCEALVRSGPPTVAACNKPGRWSDHQGHVVCGQHARHLRTQEAEVRFSW